MTDENVTRVGHRLAYKHSVAQWENVDIEYWVEDWVREGESVNSAMDRIEKLVDDRLSAKVAEVDLDFENKR